ncbi:hypothetical protein [Streptomyces sp. MP131-18]|nr:hypothetical protein [Streptomyces sp. MP131-18]ONK14484.1 hypothetical protein STBA_52690 [Streptomyces sp. MP131-18]
MYPPGISDMQPLKHFKKHPVGRRGSLLIVLGGLALGAGFMLFGIFVLAP